MPRKTKAVRASDNSLNDLLFLGFLFLGLGAGLAFGQPFAGLLIGAGIGIVTRGFHKYGGDAKMIAISLRVASYIIVLFGVYFIFLGISFLYNINWLYPTNAAWPLALIGIILLLLFAKRKMK